MNYINNEEAFKMGQEARLKGLPSSPFLNKTFWELANKINSHEPWKQVMRAYQEGWGVQKSRIIL